MDEQTEAEAENADMELEALINDYESKMERTIDYM